MRLLVERVYDPEFRQCSPRDAWRSLGTRSSAIQVVFIDNQDLVSRNYLVVWLMWLHWHQGLNSYVLEAVDISQSMKYGLVCV